MNKKQICYAAKTTTTQLQVADLNRNKYTECCEINNKSGIIPSSNLGKWRKSTAMK